jgi:hypothetical protein
MFPLLQSRETGELALEGRHFGNFPRRYDPDRVLGYFLSPASLGHPCFNKTIETLPLPFVKLGVSRRSEAPLSIPGYRREDACAVSRPRREYQW